MSSSSCDLLERLIVCRQLDCGQWEGLVSAFMTGQDAKVLLERACCVAREVRNAVYGRKVFIRGLIEVSNYCKNDCLYCGIRRGNEQANRYRLDGRQILECCKRGYELGFRTFVLQGGEDPWFTDDRLCAIVAQIRNQHPDCAITLSLGERSRESYRRLLNAGANRYLLRHETADSSHYAQLHPQGMELATRMECLRDLKAEGYQVGCGFMVGSPYQTAATVAQDMHFIQEFQPDMVGIGPFIPHSQTPFARNDAGSIELTLFLLACIRIMHPTVLLPATTALATLHPQGRELGMEAGANVLMPNLTPVSRRGDYSLYDNKAHANEEAAENLQLLRSRMSRAGYQIAVDRGDPAQRC